MESRIKLRDVSLKGFLWAFGGSGVESVLRIAVLAALARLLTPADFGLLGAALIVVGMSEVFCFVGVAPALIQRAQLETKHVQSAWTLSLLFGFAATCLIYFAAPLVAKFFRIDGLTPIVQWISVVFILHALSLVGRSLLQRELKFKTLAILDLISFVVYCSVSIGMASLGYGVMSLVGAYLSSAAVQSFLILLTSSHSKAIRVDNRAAAEMLRFGIGISIASLLNYTAKQGDSFVVGRWLGSTALGAYGRAYSLMAAPVSVAGQIMDRILFASVSKVQTERSRIGRALSSVTNVVAILTLPLSFFCIIVAPELIHLLLGSAWVSVITPFQILVLGMFFRVAYKIGGSISRGVGAVYGMARRQAVYAGIVLGGCVVGQNWGLPGVASAVLVGVVANYALNTGLALRFVDIDWSDVGAILARSAGLSILAGLPAWALAGLTREAGMGAPQTLLIVGSAWAMAMWVSLRFRPSWFIDVYTYEIIGALAGLIPCGERILRTVLREERFRARIISQYEEPVT